MREQEQEREREQHRRLERQRALPHGGGPVEHLHAGRDGDQHRGEHEEQLRRERHADREHVVRPDDERQEGDRGGRVHHGLVAEQRLAREGRDDLRDDAEGRQDQDVDLGMPEEPEDVLEHHRVAAAGGVEEGGAEEVVGEQHGHRAGEHRHHRDQQVGGDQPGPHEQRHAQQRHARRAHVHDRHHDVDGAQDRGGAHQVDREDQHREGGAGLQHQRRIHGPAAGRRAARHEQRGQQQREGERQDPEAEVVQARQRHVGRADLHRDHPVRKSDPAPA